MAKTPSHDKADEPEESAPQYPIADIVALKTVVNLLIRKGFLTQEELIAEEHAQEQEQKEEPPKVQQARILNIESNDKVRRDTNWLKEKMSHRRWTRRLGTRVFGWKWKKVKKSKEVIRIEDLPQ